MKFITALMAVSLLAGFPSGAAAEAENFDALMARDDAGFRQAVSAAYGETLPYSAAQLCRMIERLFRVDPGNTSVIDELFSAACERGNADILSELVRLFEALPADAEFARGNIFCALAGLWLQVRVPEKVLPPVKFSALPLPSLPLAKNYPQELRSALDRYREVAAPFGEFLAAKPEADWMTFQTHEPEYWKLVGQILRGEKGPFSEKLIAYGWGGGCGTGSETFMDPHSYALLLALVSDEKWSEAAGAAMAPRDSRGFRGAAHVLSACVSDPVKLLVGGLAYADCERQTFWMEGRTLPLLGLLLADRGDDRVDLLIGLASAAPPEALSRYFGALARFLPQKETGASRIVFSGFGINLDEVAVEPVSARAQRKVWDFLCREASIPLPVQAAKTLCDILGSDADSSAIEALSRLLAHPSEVVAWTAAEKLRNSGHPADIPSKLGPVRYRILIDDQPYAKHRVQWAIGRSESGQFFDVWTDEDGVVEVSRDVFTEPTSDPVLRCALRSMSMDSLEDAWWGVLLPPPPPSGEIIPIEIKTQPLAVKLSLPRSDTDWKDRKMELTLWGDQSPGNQSLGLWGPMRFKMTPQPELRFARIMAGTYNLEVRVPGATVWKGDIAAGKSAEFTVPLRQASDVAYEVRAPGGLSQWLFIPSVLQDGKIVPVDWDNYTNAKLRGVPIGKYTLHFPSRAEMKGRYLGMEPDGPDFPATDVPFEVRADSPAVIDLGPIAIRSE